MNSLMEETYGARDGKGSELVPAPSQHLFSNPEAL